MSFSLTVRPARVDDVPRMARVLVRCWQETYRGVMPDSVLDDPGLVGAREKFWDAALNDPRYRANRVAVAVRNGVVIGLAMSGPPSSAASTPDALSAGAVPHLYVLYVLAVEHGTGAGSALLNAVISPGEPATLWVADPNARAQAFYRRHGFAPDGLTKVEAGVLHVHMSRPDRSPLLTP